MTTAAQPGQTAIQPLRMITISANLLPTEVVEARRGRRARRMVLLGLALLVASIGAWYGVATYQTMAARDELVAAENDALRLTDQQRAYAEVVQTQARSAEIRTELAALLADDLRWSALLSSLRTAAPAGTELSNVSGTVTERVEGALPAGPEGQLPSTAKEASIGAISITGTSTTKAQVAAYVDALATVPGVTDPYLGAATSQGKRVGFTVRLDITAALLGGRYGVPDAAKSPAAKQAAPGAPATPPTGPAGP